MAKGFDYGALWSVARDALDAVNGLTNAICCQPRPPVAPWAIRNPPPDAHEKWQAALKALPERRAKAVGAIRKAAENLTKLLAEDRYIAPLAGVWPPRAPEVARRLSNGLVMAASAARAVIASKDDAHIDQPKRFAVDAQYTLQAVVRELERRQDVAALAYQCQIERLSAEHPDWSADEALASWQNGRGGDNGDLIERLLAGPDDVELTTRELALIEAQLKQPVSLSAIQQENRATGQSETLAKRNKLTLIRDFNRNLQAVKSSTQTTKGDITADSENPLYAFIAARQAEHTDNLIDAFSGHGPRELLADCERMICCIAGFDTVFLMSPAQAEQQAREIDASWLSGFNHTCEMLCLASIERDIDLKPFKELTPRLYLFWIGNSQAQEMADALKRLYSPCIEALFNLKRALMVEVARATPTDADLSANGSNANLAKPADTSQPTEKLEGGTERDDDQATVRLLNVFTNGLADERLGKATKVLNDDKLTVDEKLWKIDALMPFPPTTSASKLGKAMGVSKAAIQKTTWYIQKRKGQKNLDTERRREQYLQRGQQYEADPSEYDDD